MKKFTFNVARGGRGPRTYTKTEDKLTLQEIHLLVGDAINQYNKLPRQGQVMFMFYLNQALDRENDLRKQENNPSVSERSEDTGKETGEDKTPIREQDRETN